MPIRTSTTQKELNMSYENQTWNTIKQTIKYDYHHFQMMIFPPELFLSSEHFLTILLTWFSPFLLSLSLLLHLYDYLQFTRVLLQEYPIQQVFTWNMRYYYWWLLSSPHGWRRWSWLRWHEVYSRRLLVTIGIIQDKSNHELK